MRESQFPNHLTTGGDDDSYRPVGKRAIDRTVDAAWNQCVTYSSWIQALETKIRRRYTPKCKCERVAARRWSRGSRRWACSL